MRLSLPVRVPVRVVLALLLALGGCERSMRNMYEQPRVDRDEGSPLFPDGRGTRPPPPGVEPYSMGDLALASGGRRGREELAARAAAQAAQSPPTITRESMARGRARYAIACSPCHGADGSGDGMVVRRGFPAPPSLVDDRLRAAPDRHFFDVITDGHGVMPSLADRVTPEDRWAIAAYVRALQLSRAMPEDEPDPARRTAPEGAAPATRQVAEARRDPPIPLPASASTMSTPGAPR